MVDIAQRLANLSTSPPTPPIERVEPSIDNSSPRAFFAQVSNHLLLNTPNESPSSSAEYFEASADKNSKKVEFSPWFRIHKPLGLAGKSPASDENVRRLPPSRDCKSAKSILKVSTAPGSSSPVGALPPFDGSDFPRMIKSILAHLRSASRTSRLDAYSALLGSLSAYDDLPDTKTLVENLPEFLGHIRRDICATTGGMATPNTPLATQSLKLLTVFLFTPVLAESLPDDFRAYILDKSISSLEDAELPKIAVIHYMQVLAKQNFTGRHMTGERANRIVSIIKEITNRVKGNSIVNLRIRIYGRLLIQAKNALTSSAADWIDHVVSGMLSTTKDIRSLAVAFGLDAGIALGTMSSVSQACFEMFNRKSHDGRTVLDFLTNRLNDMIDSKDDVLYVPQIWSVLILLLRNRRHQLERWQHFKPWLLVIQRCLNSSDAHVKTLAMTAWNRLVLAINLDSSTSHHMIKMLRQPVVTHLNRKGGDKTSKQTRQLAHSSYCILLYYAFRPLATPTQLDIYWEQYVDRVLPESFSTSERDINQACSILAALCHTTQPRLWDENRANTARITKPDELPCLDPKWIRSRAGKIINVFEKLMSLADWNCQEKEKPPIFFAWQCFTTALGDASKQEVKVSIESMSAVAHILNFITQFWNRAYVRRDDIASTEFSAVLGKIRSMIQDAVSNIGTISFNEQRLLHGTSDRFEAADTPSSRSIRHQGTLSSPIVHLLRLLVSTVRDTEVKEGYTSILRYLLEVALHSTSSRGSQLALLRELTALVVSEVPDRAIARTSLWQLIAEATEMVIRRPRSKKPSTESPQHGGCEYRDAAKILEAGIYQHTPSSIVVWQNLHSALCGSLREDVGDGGIILTITEPLSAAIIHKLDGGHDNFLLSCSTSLIRTMAWAQSGPDIERAKRLLWGSLTSNQRPSALDPFDRSYTMVNQALFVAYASYSQLDQGLICELVEALKSALCAGPIDVRVRLVKRIQGGIATWIEDKNGRSADSKQDTSLGRFNNNTRDLWAATMAVIEHMEHSNASLALIQELLISSFRSRHRAIVNEAINLWNRSFGRATQLDYPDDLRISLARLKTITEIDLPTFPEVEDVDVVSSPFNFVESQDAEREKECPLTPRGQQMCDIAPFRHKDSVVDRQAQNSPFLDPSPSVNSSRRLANKRISKTPHKARLKHNDSQIQFAAIGDSSPLASEVMVSEIMTEHQQEIKERQSREVAMFPDLRSSPQPLSRRPDRDLPRLVLSGSKHQDQADIELDGQVSPIFPVIDGAMENFLGSSPTPRSGKKGAPDRACNSGPSSPPLSVVAQADGKRSPTVVSPVDDGKAKGKKQLEEDTLHQTRILDVQRALIVSDVAPGVGRKTDLMPNCDSEAPSRTPVSNEKSVLLSSDIHVFVDASIKAPDHDQPEDNSAVTERQANVSTSGPAIHTKQDEGSSRSQSPLAFSQCPVSKDMVVANNEATGRITDSFESQSSFYSNDEEQISAQLAADMERASSQAEMVTPHKKRKCSNHNLNQGNKRARCAPRAQSCRVVVETQRPQELDEDCILIDTRMALESPRQQPTRIKQERLSSPNMAHEPTVTRKSDPNTALSTNETARGISPIAHASLEDDARSLQTMKHKPRQSRTSEISMGQRSSRRQSTRLHRTSKKATEIQHSGAVDEGSLQGRGSSAAMVDVPSSDIIAGDINMLQPDMGEPNSVPNDPSTVNQHSRTREMVEGTPDVAEDISVHQNGVLFETLKPAGLQEHVEGRGTKGPPLLPQQGEPGQSLDQRPGPDPVQRKTTSQDILRGFRKLLGDIKQVRLGVEEERSMVGALFECVREVHEAGRRHSDLG